MPNAWIEHVKEFHKKHPKLSYSEALVKAKKSYKPVKKTPVLVGGSKKAPVKKSTPVKKKAIMKGAGLISVTGVPQQRPQTLAGGNSIVIDNKLLQ